jgi:hypothetical protein
VKTSVRVAAPVLAALAVTAALLAPLGPGSAAHAAPALTVASGLDAADPQVVPTSGDPEGIGFLVSSTEAASVTATSTGTGLTISDPVQVLAVTTTRAEYFTVHVTASTPGFHALTVTVSATGATPQQVTLPYIWANGSPAFPSTGSLAGRTYGWQGGVSIAGLESSVRATDMISFVSPTLAYLGLPPAGKPKCSTPGKGCVPYSYDTATGLVQVGTGIMGWVVGDVLHTDGFVPADESVPESFAHEVFTEPLTYPKAGSRYKGRWRYSDESYPDGLMYELVAFHKDGTCTLAFRVDNQKTRKLTGTYRIGKRGRITFLSRGRVAQVGTLIAVGKKLGKPKPSKLGFWLILSGPKGNSTDGNLLEPEKKKK